MCEGPNDRLLRCPTPSITLNHDHGLVKVTISMKGPALHPLGYVTRYCVSSQLLPLFLPLYTDSQEVCCFLFQEPADRAPLIGDLQLKSDAPSSRLLAAKYHITFNAGIAACAALPANQPVRYEKAFRRYFELYSNGVTHLKGLLVYRIFTSNQAQNQSFTACTLNPFPRSGPAPQRFSRSIRYLTVWKWAVRADPPVQCKTLDHLPGRTGTQRRYTFWLDLLLEQGDPLRDIQADQ